MNIQEFDKIKNLIDESKIISFDVFDTLILRKVSNPEDIFRIMEDKLKIPDFAKKRVDIQIKASLKVERKFNYPHADIDEIYECISEELNITDIQKIKELELKIEDESLVCNKEIYKLYEYAINQNKKVIAVSDMYIKKNFINQILKKCGYTSIVHLYISADERKAKFNGELFNYVIQSENVMPSTILHIGDNYKSDYQNAKQYGINAYHYRNDIISYDNSNLSQSLDKGINNIINKCYFNKTFWFHLGVNVGGSFYLGLLKWFIESIKEENYDKIYFLSRDGYILYNLMKELGYNNIEYLYTSRRALLLSGIDRLDEDSLNLLPPFTYGQTVKEILDYIDCNDISAESIKRVGFTGENDRIKNQEDFAKMRRLYIDNEGLVLAACLKERKFTEIYLNKLDILESNSIIFDCGWNGSSQYLLDRTFELIKYKGTNKFYYAGILNSPKAKKQLERKAYKSYLFEFEFNQDIQREFLQAIVIPELFFCAPHPSVLKYDNCGPVYEKLEFEHEYKEEIYQGILEYVKLSYDYCKNNNIKVMPHDSVNKLIKLINYPTIDEATYIGDLCNVDGFVSQNDQKKYIGKLSLISFIKNIYTEIYWPQGLVARNDINKMLKFLIKMKYKIKKCKNKDKNYKKLSGNLLIRAIKILCKEGLLTFIYFTKNKLKAKQKDIYRRWIEENEIYAAETSTLDYKPLVSVIVPVYNVIDEQLTECIESVLDQSYKNWELCLVDDASTWDSVRKILKKYEKCDKVKIKYRSKNGHISVATNDGISMSKGEYIAFLDCDDVLAKNALYEMVVKLNENRNYDFIYSDEDKLTLDGKRRHSPFFKPDWSPDTFMSLMYTCHFSIYRKTIVNEIGGLTEGLEGAQDYDFTLRFTEKAQLIGHVPKILYHWRERAESIASNPEAKKYALEAIIKLKEAALKRRGLNGRIEFVPDMYQYRVVYNNINRPMVSIIIPSKDNYETLYRCITSIRNLTGYENYEIVVVDNGSDSENKGKYQELCSKYNYTYYYDKMDFNFSKMCNIGVRLSKGSMLLFLNDDTEVITKEWLNRLVGHASLSYVGAVGAKLLYPNSNVIQHIGITNLSIGPSHSQIGFDDSIIYYYGRNRLEYNYIAVTGACLMVEKDKYLEVGGFNEELKVGYNDIDLCLKLIERGYFNVTRNDVRLYHYESFSRGDDEKSKVKLDRLLKEREVLYSNHPNFKAKDPFYNINLTECKVNYDIKVNHNKRCQCIELNCDENFHGYKSGLEAVIDTISIKSNISIEGWAFIKNQYFNNFNRIYIVLIQDNKKYLIKTQKVFRPDVTNAFLRKRNLNLSGFKCDINISDINEGTYEVALIIRRLHKKNGYFAFLGRKLFITK